MSSRIWLPASRRLTRRGALGLGLAAGATLGSRVAWAQNQPKPPAKPTGQVVVGLSQEPTVFNPLMPHIEVDQGVHWNLFSPLWGVDASGAISSRNSPPKYPPSRTAASPPTG